jgi:hypothetical protein
VSDDHHQGLILRVECGGEFGLNALRKRREIRMAEKSERQAAFDKIYADSYWGVEHLSGSGSTIEATRLVRQVIEKTIKDFHISTIIDVACGDMAWMPLVLEDIKAQGIKIDYLGCDIVSSLIKSHTEKFPHLRFQHLDFVADKIPKAELIICREALQHLPVKDIKAALKNFSDGGAKYLLTTTHLRRYGIRNHMNMKPGRCRDRNLLLPPFNLPNPIFVFPEEMGNKDKFIGLWGLPF